MSKVIAMLQDTKNTEDLRCRLELCEANFHCAISLIEEKYGTSLDGMGAEFKHLITSRGVLNDLNTIKDECRLLSAGNKQITKYIDAFDMEVVQIQSRAYDYSICNNCGTRTVVNSEGSETTCPNIDCGVTETIYNVIFDDNQYYGQNSNGGKSKRHDTLKHCEKWLRCIQAQEPDEMPREIIDAIKERVRERKIHPANLDCETIRGWLKYIKISKKPKKGKERMGPSTNYNKHIPLLRKIATRELGHMIAPPILTDEENNIILSDYSRLMHIYDRIINESSMLRKLDFQKKQKNKRYYPYFILRIAEHRFATRPWFPKFAECIHLQDSSTLKRNDLIWERMCLEEGTIKYTPTRAFL